LATGQRSALSAGQAFLGKFAFLRKLAISSAKPNDDQGDEENHTARQGHIHPAADVSPRIDQAQAKKQRREGKPAHDEP
jgi:hypothetical protein